MQRWEYLVVALDLVAGERPVVRWVNGQEVDDWKRGGSVWDYLNGLGDVGWELIGFELFGRRHTSMVLKRPKQ